nr:DNA helicase [Anaerolineae bacterium]
RVERQRKAPITVIIGNPPYNVGQVNENDNNKNRTYGVIEEKIKSTYVKSSKAGRKAQVYDAYVKFFRWASDRLQGRDGVICYVSNNSFVDQIAFDGMRKHLLQDFTQIYHLDLHGNVRQNPKLSGTTHNVFGIQVGVGITIAIRSQKHTHHQLLYYRVPEMWRKEEKLGFLSNQIKLSCLNEITWRMLTPDQRFTWLVEENKTEFFSFLPIGDKDTKGTENKAIFSTYSLGISTNRDSTIYDFSADALIEKMMRFIEEYNIEIDRYKRAGKPRNIDNFVRYDRIKWDGTLKTRMSEGKYVENSSFANVRVVIYRPFTKQLVYLDKILINSIYLQNYFFGSTNQENENFSIVLTGSGSEKPFMTLMLKNIADLHTVGAGAASQCFPFYTYDKDGSNRRENITDWALKQFQDHYRDSTITKWDIFYYVYGILHHPAYREKYADNLKRDLPRIPYLADFRSVSAIGSQLAQLHLNYESIPPYSLEYVWKPDRPVSYRVERLRLSKDRDAITVNDSLTLRGIPSAAFDYRLGNRSALEWIIYQYQVKKDDRSGIVSDPNQYSDDPQYIVKLIGRVTQVSVDTLRLITQLPEL